MRCIAQRFNYKAVYELVPEPALDKSIGTAKFELKNDQSTGFVQSNDDLEATSGVFIGFIQWAPVKTLGNQLVCRDSFLVIPYLIKNKEGTRDDTSDHS